MYAAPRFCLSLCIVGDTMSSARSAPRLLPATSVVPPIVSLLPRMEEGEEEEEEEGREGGREKLRTKRSMPLGTSRGVLGAVWDTPEGLLDISCGLEHCQHKQAVTSQSFKHQMKINVCVASPGPPGRPFSTSWGLLSLLGASWEPDGATWAVLRGLLARLTLSEAVLGASLGRLGDFL